MVDIVQLCLVEGGRGDKVYFCNLNFEEEAAGRGGLRASTGQASSHHLDYICIHSIIFLINWRGGHQLRGNFILNKRRLLKKSHHEAELISE